MPARIQPIVCPFETTAVMAYFVDAPCRTLIDTGGARHPAGPIRQALAARDRDLDTIGAIVNTHGHWDHAGGNAAVAEASGAGVLIHEAGAPLLFDHRAHLDGYYTEAARALAQSEAVEARRTAFLDDFGPEMVPNRLLKEGDRLDLGAGVTFQVLHLPGHSDDHIALYWEREGVLIAGDAAQGAGSRLGGCPLYFGRISEARASIGRLLEAPFRTLHVSHPFGRLSTQERATQYGTADGLAFLGESLTALDMLEEALGAALRDNPDAEFPALARAATEHLARAGRWPLEPDPATGVPAGAAPTLYRLWREMDGLAVDGAAGPGIDLP